jgi:hypothetical protein
MVMMMIGRERERERNMTGTRKAVACCRVPHLHRDASYATNCARIYVFFFFVIVMINAAATPCSAPFLTRISYSLHRVYSSPQQRTASSDMAEYKSVCEMKLVSKVTTGIANVVGGSTIFLEGSVGYCQGGKVGRERMFGSLPFHTLGAPGTLAARLHSLTGPGSV